MACRRPRFWLLIVAAAAAGALPACVSTKLVREWSDPAFRGPTYRKLLVMGVWEDGGWRRTFEDHFVKKLRARGIEAVPSYRLIPEDGQVPRERVVAAVERSRADAVLLTRLKGTQESSHLYEGGPEYSSGGAVVQDVHGTYSVFWAGVHPSTQETDDTVWTLETKAFDAARQTLVWDGIVQLENPESVAQGSNDLAQAVVNALVKKGMIP